jgi:hypothetical protein
VPTDWDDAPSRDSLAEIQTESSDYYAGFTSVNRELSIAQTRGFTPTERQLVLALTHIARIYATARSGKPIGGRSPDWLRGRLDGLRASLRNNTAARAQTE